MHKDIASTRSEIAAKRRELRALQSGDVRVPLNVALGRVDELLAAQASEAGGWIQSLIVELTLAGRSAPARVTEARDHRTAQAVLVALMPDLIGGALKDRVRAEYAGNSTETVHPDQLPLLIASAERELLTLEVRDVQLSEKHGEPPRPDTDARALLGVAA